MVERTTYLRKDLLELRWSGHGLLHSIPAELKVAYRGCRAGAKVKARRRRYKPCLPSILMGNVNSLLNKCDELVALRQSWSVFHEWFAGLHGVPDGYEHP